MRNKHGIGIREVCAACACAAYDRVGYRVCKAGNGCVDSGYSCPAFTLREGLQNIGEEKGAGRVKTKEYLDFVLAAYLERSERIAAGESLPPLTAEILRENYERQFGESIYINI